MAALSAGLASTFIDYEGLRKAAGSSSSSTPGLGFKSSKVEKRKQKENVLSRGRVKGRRSSIRVSAAAGGPAEKLQAQLEQQLKVSDYDNQSGLFGRERELSAPQSIIRSLPAPARYAACAGIVVGAVGAGYTIGSRVLQPWGQAAGALVLGAIGAGAAHLVNASGKEVAAVELRNAVINHPNPQNLKHEEVEAIAQRFGVSLQDERFSAELRELYDCYVSGIIPPGNENLSGDEADGIIKFRDGLGLEDDEAAGVHIEIGRRIFRQRLETGDRDAAVEERRTFQKLVYVSTLVFGEKSKFLLPWKRVFKVTDAQVDVAVRDNAQRLFLAKLQELGIEPDMEKLKALRMFQQKYRLGDEVAGDLIRTEARKKLEGCIGRALEVVKSRARVKDMRRVMKELDDMRHINAALADVAQKAAANDEQIVPGVGAVTVFGGEYETDRQMDDLKLLYRAYLSDVLESDKYDDASTEALAQLRNIFGMGKKEAADVTADVTAKMYRKKLAKAVSSGELEKAASKAAFLQDLCDRLRFDPEAASAIHEDIYRQKLEQCLTDNSLSDEDVSALLRLRVMLCIPKAVVGQAHADICGRVFLKVVDEAIGAGIDGYDADMKKAVQDASKGLRLPQSAALDIAKKAVRAMFMAYIKRSRASMGRMEAARELKKMVIFSNITVSQLLDDIKGQAAGQKPEDDEAEEENQKAAEAAAKKEFNIEEDFDEQLEMLQSLKKTRGPAKEGKAQKEINLKDEIDLRERQDLYRTFLLYCLQGETTGMPMGTQIVVQKDESDFVRLSQLGDILGLTPMEVGMVHQGLAEQAFKSQAQTLLADGQLSKARAEQLKEIQRQCGLPDAAAQKVIKEITGTKMASAIDQAVQQGRLAIEDVRDLKEAGVDIQQMVSLKVRTTMYEKFIERALSSGTGDIDQEELLNKIPADLGLEEAKASAIARDMAKAKLQSSLVQAVSLLRQRKQKGVATALNNLLACDAVERKEGVMEWGVREEVLDLFSLYVAEEEHDRMKAERLQQLLGIDEEAAVSLRETVASGGFAFDTQEENFVF